MEQPLLIEQDSSYSATSIVWDLGPGRCQEESVSHVMAVMDRHRPVVLRPARRQDAAAISRCVLRAYQHFVPRMGRPPAPMTDDYNQVVLRNIVWVADDGLGIQGVVELEETDVGLLTKNMAVDPDFQKQGLGRRLLKQAEQLARDAGHDMLYIYISEAMVENLVFYLDHGYEECERRLEQGIYRRIYLRKTLL
ncbi:MULTISPECIES: GNAT family N-acetyltransferase [Alcanivorax]|nr:MULTISPECIES: GNAT family N-acetyltransferase [Alcanivorax]